MCILELPEFQALQERYGDQVQVVLAGTGGAKRLEELRGDKAPGVQLVMANDAFLEAMGLSAFPETLFIDAQGRVAEHLRDGADLDYFAPRVEALLREAAAPEGASTKASPLITPSSEEAPSADRGSHGIISRLTFRFLEWRKR